MGSAQPGRSSVVRFDEFELDVRAGDLRRNGERIPLQPKVAELLSALLERPGELVTRDEVRAKLWGSETFVDFDDSVNHAVRKLRDCLGDTADHPRFVETIPKRGYRFLAPVEPVVRRGLARDGTSADTGGSDGSRLRRTWWLAAGATILGAVAIAAIAYTVVRSTPPAPSRVMLAVLPIENLTGSDDKEYLSDGLTEEIVTELGRLNPAGLGVIARTSTARYKHTTKTIAEIGRELGVGYVIEGSVRADGARLRVTVQLIRVSDQSHVWTEAYDCDSPDTLSIQREVAQQTTRALAITLLPDAQRRLLAETRRVSPEAREAYLKGRFWTAKGTGPAILEGNKLLQQAVVLDPDSAPAHAALATSWICSGTTACSRLQTCGRRPRRPRAARLPSIPPTWTRGSPLPPSGWSTSGTLRAPSRTSSPRSAPIPRHERTCGGRAAGRAGPGRRGGDGNSSGRTTRSALASRGRRPGPRAVLRQAERRGCRSTAQGHRTGADLVRPQHARPRAAGEGSTTRRSSNSKRVWPCSRRQTASAPGLAMRMAWRGASPGKRMRAIQEAHLEKTGVGAEALSLTHLGAGDTEQAFAWLERAYQARAGMTMLKAYPYWIDCAATPASPTCCVASACRARGTRLAV